MQTTLEGVSFFQSNTFSKKYFMEHISMNIQNLTGRISFISGVILLAIGFAGCEADDPQKEDVPELITKVTLTFTPDVAGDAVVVTATDPDGMGLLPIDVDGSIDLLKNTSYTLTIEMINELAEVSDPAHDITGEVREEGDEHLFYFSWTNNVFSDPDGDGNVDSLSDDVNYEDEDENGLPVGLTSSWSTPDVASSGAFHVLLKHQPGLKSETSASTAGETDLDLLFEINIE